jgi:hypothetical protein
MKTSLCECGCGKEVAKMGNRFLIGHNRAFRGKKHSPESIAKFMGHPNRPKFGKDGLTPWDRFDGKFVGSSARWWKKKLMEEIGKCEQCGWGNHPEILDLHHLDLDQKNNVRENVLLLCPNCHVWIHWQSGTGRYAMGKALKGKKGKDHPRHGNRTYHNLCKVG